MPKIAPSPAEPNPDTRSFEPLVLTVDPTGVSALCSLPNEQLASGDDDGYVMIWEREKIAAAAAKTGGTGLKLLLRLKGHTGVVRVLCSLIDGRIASGGDDGQVLIWDLKAAADNAAAVNAGDDTIKPMLVLLGHNDGAERPHVCSVFALCSLPGGRLATGGIDEFVHIWDIQADYETKVRPLYPLLTLRGHTFAVFALCLLHDRRLASSGYEGFVLIWDFKAATDKAGAVNAGDDTIKPLLILEGHKECGFALCSLPDGRLASGSIDEFVLIWDLQAAANYIFLIFIFYKRPLT